MKPALLEQLTLRGLELAPAQVWGGIRLVPLLRREIREDLRLGKRDYDEDLAVVALEGKPMAPGLKYISYIPHGLVMSWSEDGSPAAAFGTQLQATDGKRLNAGPFSVRVAHRMVRREAPRQLRMLPMHLAMEGYLALHFDGPDIAWTEYSRQVISHGLSPRSERSLHGSAIVGLEDALRVFEMHGNQVGVLLFVADALASAFVLPHPADYALLHRTLLADFYGPTLYHYALHATSTRMETSIDETRVSSLADLRRGLATMRSEWAEHYRAATRGIFDKRVTAERVYRAGPFQLQRFITSLDLADENHLGEAIVRDTGELEYLKSYRLSATQSRRAYLLHHLALHSWNLEAAAASLGQSKDELIRRLDKAGFGYILKDHVLHAARRRR